MKAMLVLALAACAAAMPSPAANPDPGFVYNHPFVYSSYPVVKTVKAETPASTTPLLYTYGHQFPLTYSYSHLPYNYAYNFPYNFPYNYPFVVKASEEEDVMSDEEEAPAAE